MSKRPYHEEWLDHIIAMSAGELNPGEAEALNAHLQGCQYCAEELKEYEQMARYLEEVNEEGLYMPLPPAMLALQREIAEHNFLQKLPPTYEQSLIVPERINNQGLALCADPGLRKESQHMAHPVRKFGWLPDLPDQRDLLYSVPIEHLQALPPQINLSAGCPPVYDQGQLGSCTANAIAAALQFDELKQNEVTPFEPSRLFIYYNERIIENTVSSDSGARIRDGIKSVGSTGYCPETEWPYDITKFADQPPAACYQDAKRYKAVKYQRVIQSLRQMKGCLAVGTPFVAGFSVYESIHNPEVEKTGDIPLPQQGESLLGGHAILIVGYDDTKRVFNLRSSWGDGWGDGGYGTLPYAYLTSPDLAGDFWVITTVS